jgi:hypothetical protein
MRYAEQQHETVGMDKRPLASCEWAFAFEMVRLEAGDIEAATRERPSA